MLACVEEKDEVPGESMERVCMENEMDIDRTSEEEVQSPNKLPRLEGDAMDTTLDQGQRAADKPADTEPLLSQKVPSAKAESASKEGGVKTKLVPGPGAKKKRNRRKGVVLPPFCLDETGQVK